MSSTGRDKGGRWSGTAWDLAAGSELPVVTHPHVTGTGTRTLREKGERAIDGLLELGSALAPASAPLPETGWRRSVPSGCACRTAVQSIV